MFIIVRWFIVFVNQTAELLFLVLLNICMIEKSK